jgi:hypothetical protein
MMAFLSRVAVHLDLYRVALVAQKLYGVRSEREVTNRLERGPHAIELGLRVHVGHAFTVFRPETCDDDTDRNAERAERSADEDGLVVAVPETPREGPKRRLPTFGLFSEIFDVTLGIELNRPRERTLITGGDVAFTDELREKIEKGRVAGELYDAPEELLTLLVARSKVLLTRWDVLKRNRARVASWA